mgnify:CR=1 FL=1
MNFYLATDFLSDLLVKSFGMKTLSGEVLEIAKDLDIPRGYLNDRCSLKPSINVLAAHRLIKLFDAVLSEASNSTKAQAVNGLCTVLANCFAFSKEQIGEVVDTLDEDSGNELLVDLLKTALENFTGKLSVLLPFAVSTGIQTIRYYNLPVTIPIPIDYSGNALILITDIPESARVSMLRLHPA